MFFILTEYSVSFVVCKRSAFALITPSFCDQEWWTSLWRENMHQKWNFLASILLRKRSNGYYAQWKKSFPDLKEMKHSDQVKDIYSMPEKLLSPLLQCTKWKLSPSWKAYLSLSRILTKEVKFLTQFSFIKRLIIPDGQIWVISREKYTFERQK